METRHLAGTIIVCLASLATADEFRANVRTAGNQSNVAITAQRNGPFAIAWSSYFSGSGRSNDIIVRRFRPDGRAAGDEFRVNAIRTGNQTEPALAISDEGLLFVVWQGPGAEDDEDIFARVFDLTGQPITDEFGVNAHVAGRQLYPRVTACANGVFAVVWESRQPDETISVRGRLFDSAGVAVGDEFLVDEGLWKCRYPDVAADGAGGFATVWMRDRSSKAIYARLFDAKGAAMGAPLAVSTAGIASVTRPSIAMNETGDFVVVWDGDPKLASLDDIHARRYGPGGMPRSGSFVVNAYRDGRQQWPRVAMGTGGGFVVVWQHEDDNSEFGADVAAQHFDRNGQPCSSEGILNSHVDGKQRYPVVAMSRHGAAIAAWESDDQDGSGYGIFARVEAGADVNADGVTDFGDFCLLGRSWRGDTRDLTGDGSVDARDLKKLCRHWLE
jgi:hypothetical protein